MYLPRVRKSPGSPNWRAQKDRDRDLVERGGNHLKGVKEVRTEAGSSQGNNLALTELCVPRSLDSRGASETGSFSRRIDFCITQL